MYDRKKPGIVILISGSGSNLQAFIDHIERGDLDASIACVISNRPDAPGIERAKKAGINTRILDHTTFSNREEFDVALINIIAPYQPSLIVLAGFMRILTNAFVSEFRGRLINIHPSLLPKYPGLDTHQRAINAGDKEAGVTVHFVTEELDGGPPILQATVPIGNNDTKETLAAKVLKKEHIIYPLTAEWFLSNRLRLKGTTVFFDGSVIGERGIQFNDSLMT